MFVILSRLHSLHFSCRDNERRKCFFLWKFWVEIFSFVCNDLTFIALFFLWVEKVFLLLSYSRCWIERWKQRWTFHSFFLYFMYSFVFVHQCLINELISYLKLNNGKKLNLQWTRNCTDWMLKSEICWYYCK